MTIRKVYHGTSEETINTKGLFDGKLNGISANGHLLEFPGMYVAQDFAVAEHYARLGINGKNFIHELNIGSGTKLLDWHGAIDSQPIDLNDVLEAWYYDGVVDDLVDAIDSVAPMSFRQSEELAQLLLIESPEVSDIFNDANFTFDEFEAWFEANCQATPKFTLQYQDEEVGRMICHLANYRFGAQGAMEWLTEKLTVSGAEFNNAANGIETEKNNILVWDLNCLNNRGCSLVNEASFDHDSQLDMRS